jgi:hypothetical protein
VKFIRVKKWMTIPQLEAAAAFEECVNSNEYQIPGLGVVGPGESICDTVDPLEAIVASTIKVPVEINLRYRKGQSQLAAGIWDSWQSRHFDCGYMGVHDVSTTDTPDLKRRRFYTDNDELPSHPVLLDGTGAPLDPPEGGIKFKDDASVDSFDDSPAGADVDDTVDGAVFLIYTDTDVKDFGGFNIF